VPERDGRTGRVPVLLVMVLLLVLGAFGLLVIALVTGNTGWAWGSVAASAVAGVLLVTDWIARPKGTAGPANRPTAEPASPAGWPTAERVSPADLPAAEPVSSADLETVEPVSPADRAPVEPEQPPAAGDMSRAATSDTPQAPAVERMEASTRRTGATEPGRPDAGLGQPPEPG
jgi:hypothetical protein